MLLNSDALTDLAKPLTLQAKAGAFWGKTRFSRRKR
jgi:hypothetical protein